jgi:hypothetical protein
MMVMSAFARECLAGPLIALSPDTAIEVVKSLSVEQLWWSTRTTHIDGGNFHVQYALFDQENHPSLGGRAGCGWLMVGSPDLASEPVGVRVWSKGDDTYQACSFRVLAEGGPESASDTRFQLRLGRREVFKIRVDEHGNVSIGGHAVGTIN